MDLEVAVQRRRPFRQFNRPSALLNRDNASSQQQQDNLIVIESHRQVNPTNELWVPALNKFVKVTKPITKLAIRSVLEGLNCVVSNPKDLSELSELAVLASLSALNEYRYPQVIVVLKESRDLKELSNLLTKSYDYQKEALNCVTPNLSIVLCLFSKLGELDINYSKVTLITMLGAFEVEEIGSVEALKDRSRNNASILLLLSHKNSSLKVIKTNIHAKFTFITESETEEFEKQMRWLEKQPIVSLYQSPIDLFLTLRKYRKSKNIIIYAKTEHLSFVSSFTTNNFRKITVEDADQVNYQLLTQQTVLCYGFKLKTSANSCKKLIYFIQLPELSLLNSFQKDAQNKSQSQIYNIQDFLVQDSSTEQPEQKQESSAKQQIVQQLSFRKKNPSVSESLPSLPKSAQPSFPISLLQLQYNHTWVRLTTQLFHKVPNYVVVMHKDYIRIPIDLSLVEKSLPKKPEENFAHLKLKNQRMNAFILKEQINSNIFEAILTKTANLGDSKITFFESPMLTAELLLKYVSNCELLNLPNCVVLIMIVFADELRFRNSLNNLIKA